MEALLVSTFTVAIAELGDKTQLLAILLAVRFRTVWPILAGILVATVANHLLAAAVGAAAAQLFDGVWFRWVLGGSFMLMAVWALIPDRVDADTAGVDRGAFVTTTVAFFLAEMADKTQLATAMLAASFESIVLVTVGSTIGMLLVNAPTVWVGQRFALRLPLRTIRIAAALTFVALGVWIVLAHG